VIDEHELHARLVEEVRLRKHAQQPVVFLIDDGEQRLAGMLSGRDDLPQRCA